jgi:hypothetical protein
MEEPMTAVEKKIERVAKTHGLSEQGKLWMENCLDPFPDEPRGCEGYPDTVCGPSVVQKLKIPFTVKCPTALLGANWDCVIKTSHVENSVLLQKYDNHNGAANPIFEFASEDLENLTTGGLDVYAVATDSTLNRVNCVGSVAPPRAYFSDGKTRVIAKGFEVTNTTATLYKQGSVTMWRSPSLPTPRIGNFMQAGSVTPSPLKRNVNEPDTVSAVVLPIFTAMNCLDFGDSATVRASIDRFDDTKTWAAEKGCYCVCTMGSSTNMPFSEDDGKQVYMYDAGAPNEFHTQRVKLNGSNTGFQLYDGENVAYPTVYNESGAWFTGLSPQTSLQVVYHVVIERFVNENALDLVVMTTKSSSFDPEALELYSRAATLLPVGVPVANNASGDWIKNVADMLGTIGVPGMSFVKGGVDLYNTIYPTKGQTKNQGQKKKVQNLEKRVNNVQQKEKQLVRAEKKIISAENSPALRAFQAKNGRPPPVPLYRGPKSGARGRSRK